MPFFFEDQFIGTAGAEITARPPEIGGPWIKHPTVAAVDDLRLTDANRCRSNSNAGRNLYLATAEPPLTDGIDFLAEWGLYVRTKQGQIGFVFRAHATEDSYYLVQYHGPNGQLELYRRVAGVSTLLAAAGVTVALDTLYRIGVEVRGERKRVLFAGGQVIESFDSVLADDVARRKVGLFSNGGPGSNTTGGHVEFLELTDLGPLPPPPEPPPLAPGTIALRIADNSNAIKPPNHGGDLTSDWDEWNVNGLCTIDYDTARAYGGERSVKMSKSETGERIMRAIMYPPPRTYPPSAFFAQEGDVVWFGGAFWLVSGQVHSHTRLVGLSRYNGTDVFSVLALVLSGDQLRLLCENYPATPSVVYDLTPQSGVTFPRDRWVWVDCGFKINNSDIGQAELWMDGVRVGPRKSGRTLTQPVGYDTVQFGAGTVAGDPVDVWIDRSYVGPIRDPGRRRVRNGGIFAPGVNRVRANGGFATARVSAP